MLQTLREKTSGKIAAIILGLMVIPFAFFGIDSYMSQRVDTYVARISQPPTWWKSAPSVWPVSLLWSKHDIDSAAYRERLETTRMRQREERGEAFDARAFESADNKRAIVDQLVDEQIMRLDAARAGIVVSDQEVRDLIQSLEQFQVDGRFDAQRYQLMLASQNPPQTPLSFQQKVRDNLTYSLIPDRLSASAFTTASQLQRVLRLLGETRDVTFALLPVPAPDTGPVTDAQAKAWYDAHTADFAQPETVRLEYVQIKQADLQVPPADEATLRSRYQEQQARYAAPEQRLVSHILVQLPKGGDAKAVAAAEARANQLAAQARAPGADFAALAKASSEDVGSKGSGGDLGWTGKGTLPGPLEAAAFSMAAGEVRGPVKTDFGWHIVQVREIRAGRQQTFESVREQLLAEYAQTEHERLFGELTGRLVDEVMKAPSSLAPAARALGLQVQTTPAFTRGGGAGIAANPKVIQAAFSESMIADQSPSDPIELAPGDNVIVRVIEHQAQRPLALAQVRAQVEAAVRADRASKAAAAAADALVQAAKSGNLQAVASARGLPTTNIDGMERNAQLPSRQAVEQVFRAARPAAGKTTLHRMALEDGRFLVFEVRGVHPGSDAAISEEERKTLREQLARAAGMEATASYLRETRKQYKITVAEDRL